MSYENTYFESMSRLGGFERRYEKNWKEAECDGRYKGLGLLHFGVDKKCRVQVWHDKITGVKRWWFGLSFDGKETLDEFAKVISKETLPHFNENVFNKNWLMRPISEKWKGEKEWYLGIYSKKGKELEAIASIVQLSKKFDNPNYLRINRKYGEGEGLDHLELKTYIFHNPQVIGLSDVIEKHLEYPFLYTGDRADIMFSLRGGKYIVVEIETNRPLPGLHQSLKYKTLMCSSRGLPVNSAKVSACLVAWEIPESIKKLCNKYGVGYFEVQP